MFPIGRYLTLSADDSFPKNPEELSVGYIFNNPECGDGIETHTVREWFRSFNIPLKDDYFFTWTRTQATLCKHLQFLEEHISEKTMISIWNATLITLYLNYDITEDFQTQFQQNSEIINNYKYFEPTSFGRLFFISLYILAALLFPVLITRNPFIQSKRLII